MHFGILVIFALSFFANGDRNDIPKVVPIKDPQGADVFCVLATHRWAKPANIHEKFPSARRVGVARLPYHRLDFKYYYEDLKGSVATIAPDCGYEVWGAIYFIPFQDLDLVLSNGGIINNQRISKFVQNEVEAYYYGKTTAVKLTCGSFQQIDLPEKLKVYGLPLPENQRPSRKILDGMIEAFTDAGLPKQYIEEISQLPVRSQDVMCSQSKQS